MANIRSVLSALTVLVGAALCYSSAAAQDGRASGPQASPRSGDAATSSGVPEAASAKALGFEILNGPCDQPRFNRGRGGQLAFAGRQSTDWVIRTTNAAYNEVQPCRWVTLQDEELFDLIAGWASYDKRVRADKLTGKIWLRTNFRPFSADRRTAAALNDRLTLEVYLEAEDYVLGSNENILIFKHLRGTLYDDFRYPNPRQLPPIIETMEMKINSKTYPCRADTGMECAPEVAEETAIWGSMASPTDMKKKRIQLTIQWGTGKRQVLRLY
ncbi:MAG: hypothetical protein R3C52_05980 [Hyphomonadaceae bacterium]